MNMNIKTLNGVDTKTLHSEVTSGKITDGKVMFGLMIQPAAGNCLQRSHLKTNKITSVMTENGDSTLFFRQFRIQTENAVYATGCEDSTPRRTHMFLSLLVSSTRTLEHFFLFTHVRVAQVCTKSITLVMLRVVCPTAHQKHLFIHDVSSPIFSALILSHSPHFALHHLRHLRQHALRSRRGHR